MRTVPIIGDPTSIGNAINKIHMDNPKMKVISTCAAPYVIQQPNQLRIGQPQAVQVHVYYMTYENPGHPDGFLVDEKGKVLSFQVEPLKN